MAPTAPPGFIARNNQVIGSVLSILALAVAALLGAGLMLNTDTRGVRAILTVLTIAGGAFTLFLLLIDRTLAAATTPEQWEQEENQWRATMALPPLEDGAEPSMLVRLRVPLAVLAIVIGLSLSVLPAML
ncbi:MAG: hypothetical protein L0H31_00210 [Nocardioidaceae bacterium]|nr:hypothetical protein [Nocardioidaceae bacterium]